jgi:signal transduction histidine kinase
MLELLKVSVSKQIDLKIELDKKLPAVLGSAAQIRQVVMNLVINASDAIGSKEGIIYITTSLVTREYGSGVTGAADFPAGDYVRLGVSDTGCGMTEEVSEKIFDPFFTTNSQAVVWDWRLFEDRSSPRRRGESGECSWPRRDVSGLYCLALR